MINFIIILGSFRMHQNMKENLQSIIISDSKKVGEEISMTTTNWVLGVCNETNVFNLVAIQLVCF